MVAWSDLIFENAVTWSLLIYLWSIEIFQRECFDQDLNRLDSMNGSHFRQTFFFEFFCISMFNLIYFLSLFQIYSRKNIDKYTHNCTYFNIKSLLFMHLGIMGKNFIYSILNFLLFFSSFFLILEQISFRHSDDV